MAQIGLHTLKRSHLPRFLPLTKLGFKGPIVSSLSASMENEGFPSLGTWERRHGFTDWVVQLCREAERRSSRHIKNGTGDLQQERAFVAKRRMIRWKNYRTQVSYVTPWVSIISWKPQSLNYVMKKLRYQDTSTSYIHGIELRISKKWVSCRFLLVQF